jgi:hypothetical protein
MVVVACGSSHETVDAYVPKRADAPPASALLGEICNAHGDCVSGYCVEALGGVGGQCTRPCSEGCPSDWGCRSIQIDGNPVELCVPNAPQLCLACASDTECGTNGVCIVQDGVGSCATQCTSACPTGYACGVDPTGVHAGTYCQPVTGSCSCSEELEGASRACVNTNTIGTCYGTQTCSAATGWSSCDAATAAVETCDGVDNDCDFLTDEAVGGGDACSITNSFGTCPGTLTCTGAAGFTCEGQTPAMETCNYADDDCDGTPDEGFPTLGTLCSPGVGACQRYGSVRCRADGTGVECSVTAGMPAMESCNGNDDDCDGMVDETFPTLGTACTAGLGVCTRFGTTICSGDGSTTMCSASAGTNSSTETCNYLDDDCNGIVDDGFRNAISGLYDTTGHCGACGNDCTAVYTGANSTGTCSTASGSAQCVMVCDTGTYNLNSSTADGCEFVLDTTTIYVSTADAQAVDDSTCGLGPTGTGGGNHPCKTITYGLARAGTTNRSNVRVADGTYNEAITLVSGKNLYGGYYPNTWERHLATTNTVLQGVSSSGNHDRTVIATNVTSSLFEGFVVRGAFNAKPAGNSYAIYVSGGASTLTIRNNQIFGGRGGPGVAGVPGTNGLSGVSGTGSVNGSYDGFVATGSGACNTSNNRQFTNGGARTCGPANVSGGHGGGNRCPPASDFTQYSGISGFAGNSSGGAAGAGGQGGYDGTLSISGGNSTCSLPAQPMFGADGAPGQPGSHGGSVAGCSSAAGSVTSGHWVNGGAVAGSQGTHGGGAGGGGAGGGGLCTSCPGNEKDRLGAHGGGGGSGGCGGTGGGAGGAGGGVFGIFIVGGAAPTITDNTIQRGAGGSAGDGGIGGAGGLGGAGAPGGDVGGNCSAKAGRGGDGGNAGHGSGGGGGCGGSSFGIYTSGIGTPTYCSTNTVSGGSAGAGGQGGFSGGSSGGEGAAGNLVTCASS